jgi:hypothetical protein
MDPKIAGRMLDRIADLSRGNEQRTMEYIMGGVERQKRLRENKAKGGLTRMELWMSDEQKAALRERFPGPRGGIDWDRVIQAATDSAAPSLAKLLATIRALAPGDIFSLEDLCDGQEWTAMTVGKRQSLGRELKAVLSDGQLAVEFAVGGAHALHYQRQ